MASKLACFVLIAMTSSVHHVSPGEVVARGAAPCHCTDGGTTADCGSAYLESVPTVACKTTSKLLVFNLSWNNFSVLGRDAFEKLVALRDLLLDNAGVRLVHKDAFHNLKDLRTLDLSFNYVEQLHPETFRHLENLQELRLRQNPLKVLENNIFSGLKSLTTLDLRSCGLVSVSAENFRREVSQETTLEVWPAGLFIDLSDNPLDCNCALKDFHDLVAGSSSRYENLTCTQPEDLRGYPLRLLDSADLRCKPYEILFPARNTTLLAPRGRNVTLSCRIANDVRLPWLKRWTFHAAAAGGEASLVVDSGTPRLVISSSNLWLNLTIERVRASDQGLYRCEVYSRGDRPGIYRGVSLAVVDGTDYSTGDHDEAGQTINTTYAVALGVVALATLLSVAVVVLVVVAGRKPDVYDTKRRRIFKKSRDFMITVPFYASSDGLLPPRPLPRRPGSEVLPWWLEYPEHLYEGVSTDSLDQTAKQTTRPGDVQYDREHYVRPAVTKHTYTTVLPDED